MGWSYSNPAGAVPLLSLKPISSRLVAEPWGREGTRAPTGPGGIRTHQRGGSRLPKNLGQARGAGRRTRTGQQWGGRTQTHGIMKHEKGPRTRVLVSTH